MLRRFYNLLFPVAFVLLLPNYLRRMIRRGNYRENFAQRFGWYAPTTRERLAATSGAIWVQAVSVGEMLVALKLINALRAQDPALPLILSTTTTTGYDVAKKQAPAGVEIVYTPIDLLGAVRRAFNALRPAQLIIVDGGLWPNQLWEAQRRKIPTALVNARLSPRSERRFGRFPRLAGALFGLLDIVCVAEPGDVSRWQKLGINLSRLRHTGSIKFDDAGSIAAQANEAVDDWALRQRAKQDLLASLGITPDTPVLLAGSTHPAEERVVGEVFLKLRIRFPNLFFIVAPRHVERTNQVRKELEALGLTLVLRTDGRSASPLAPPNTLLLNTTGELREWYRSATLVFIGKSLHAIGGQNPAEAIAAGVPVIFGPHMENFEDLTARLLAADAAVQVATTAELERRCEHLLSDAKERTRLCDAAQKEIATHRGAAARTATLVLSQRQNSACQAL